MIPRPGANPKVNVLVIGAQILARLDHRPRTIEELLINFSDILNVSGDHIILSLDWLYALSAIEINGELIVKK